MTLETLLQAAGRIPQDKLLHFAAGSIFAMVGMAFGPLWSLLLVTGVGLGKEVYDAAHPMHTADPLDLMATVLGGLPVWLAVVLA